MIRQLACTSLWAARHFIIGVMLHTCSTIIIFRIVADLAIGVVCSIMRGVICCKVSPYPSAAKFASTYDLTIINRYNRSAIARHLYPQGVANTTDVATDAHVYNWRSKYHVQIEVYVVLVRKYEVFSVLVSELTPWIKKWDDPIFYIRKEQIEKLYKVFCIDNSENRSTKIRIKS